MTNDNTEPMSVEGAIRCLETWESVLIAVKGTAGRIAALIRSMEERHEKGEKWSDQIIDDQAEEIKEMDLKIDELKAQLAQKDNEIAELKNRVRKQEMLNADLILDAKEIQLAHEICRDKL